MNRTEKVVFTYLIVVVAILVYVVFFVLLGR